MEKISEMIERLCPEGVETLPLGSILDYEQPGKYIVKNTDYVDEGIPVLTAGQRFLLGYTNEDTGIYQASKENPTIIFDDFTTSFHWVDFDFKVKSSAMKMLRLKREDVVFRYVYYCMCEIGYIPVEHSRQWISLYSNFEIPLPPLSIQQEIVRILDSFTSMITNLETELASRQKQYEFYRNELLTFDDNDESVEWKTLGEGITRLRTGLNPRVHFKLNTADAIGHYVTVRELKGFSIEVDDKTDRINEAAIKRINERSKLKVGDVLFSGTGTIGRTAIVEEEPRKWNIKEGVYALTPNLKMITSRFMIYSLHTIGVVTQIENKAGGSTVKSIPMTELKNIIIPIPSLIRQQEIVSTLDTFESLISNIKQELEARKKQYEYYREQLLTFRPSPALP